MSNRYGGSAAEWFVAVKNGAYVRPSTPPTVTFWSGPPEDLGRVMYADLRALDDPDTPINSVRGLANGTLPEFDQLDESITRMWASTDGGVTGTWITTTSLPSQAQGALAETAIQPDGAGKLPESAVPERLTEAGLSETIGDEVGTEGTPARVALNTAYVGQVAAAKSRFRDANLVTDGTYERVQPTPDAGSAIHPLAVDPNVSGRLWGWGTGSAQIGYTDDDGGTWTNVVALPDSTSTHTPVQIEFSANFMWLVTGLGSSGQTGRVHRSPLPAADGTGLTFTKVMDLNGMAGGPGGAAAYGAGGSCFRNQSFAIQPDESYAYLLEYGSGSFVAAPSGFSDGMMAAGSNLLVSPSGAGNFSGWHVFGAFSVTIPGAGPAGADLVTTIKEVLSSKMARVADPAQTAVSAAAVTYGSKTVSGGVVAGGPSARVCSNPGAADPSTITWARTMVWPYAKHGHAVKLVNGVPWWALGDVGYPGGGWGVYTGPQQLGVYASPTAAATSNRILFGANGGFDAINIFPVTIEGQPCVVGESDNTQGTGPIGFPMQDSSAQSGSGIPMHRLPFPHIGTMRGLTLLPDDTMLYLATGEQSSKQPLDSVIMSAPPYDTCVVLDSAPVGTIYNTVIGNGFFSGGYVWFGTWRVKVPAWAS